MAPRIMTSDNPTTACALRVTSCVDIAVQRQEAGRICTHIQIRHGKAA